MKLERVKKEQFFIKNRRGEITTTQLVTIIILIASFSVILFFIFRLNLGEITDKEICHNSVLARGSSILPSESIPLNCRRNYLCLTSDGSCETLTKPIKEKVDAKEEVYNILAEEMANCWWMFGQGEVNYVGDDFFEKLYCSICTQVAFDDSLKEKFTERTIDKEDLYVYMRDNKVSGRDETYLSYLYGTNDLVRIKEEFDQQNVGFGSIDLDKQYYIMMGITSEVSKLQWAIVGAGTVATIAFLPIAGTGWGIGFGLAVASGAVGGTGGSLLGFMVEGLSGNEYLSPSVIEVNSQEFEDLDCESIITLS